MRYFPEEGYGVYDICAIHALRPTDSEMERLLANPALGVRGFNGLSLQRDALRAYLYYDPRVNGKLDNPQSKTLVALSRSFASLPPVLLQIAGKMQYLSGEDRWQVAEALVQRDLHEKDRNLALMIWYGIEPLVAEDPKRALKLAAKSKIPLIRQFIARRVVDLNKAK